jgi:hypothetical protein
MVCPWVSLSTKLTVLCDTPASRATSMLVIRLEGRLIAPSSLVRVLTLAPIE